MKQCTVCEEHKPLEEFYNSASSKDGKGYRCKPCDLAVRAMSRSRSPGTVLGYRRRMVAKKYGMTVEEYDTMLADQDGKCAICGTDNPAGEGNSPWGKMKTMSFSIDHCHDTGKVRGLLCNTCNRGLGFFKDNAGLLGRAIQYLDCH